MHRIQSKAHIAARPQNEWPGLAVLSLGTQTRIVRGARFHHRVIEAGWDNDELLVLIHGVGGHAETYLRNLAPLATRFHVVAIDAMFHGYSSKDGWDGEQWLEIMADGVAELIVALGYERAHVEGESMGALVTFELGMRHPARCGKLVLNTGHGSVKLAKTDFQPTARGFHELLATSREAVLEPTFPTMRKRMDWLVHDASRMTDEMVDVRLALYRVPEVRESMRRVYRLDEKGFQLKLKYDESVYASFPHDTLVFWTEHNPGHGPDVAEYVAQRLKNGSLYVMADAGHWPQWEKPEEHDAALLEFLGR